VTLLEEWVEKAEGDYTTAVVLKRQRKEPQYDAICYHCQQSAEKYLKAYLVKQGVVPQRIHDLLDLLSECIIYDAGLSSLWPDVRFLNPFSVQFRYPGDTATDIQAKDALENLRRILRRKLGLL
jgi:HEPN domain-containing protein